MIDFLEKKIFSFYIWYHIKSPIKKGNAFFGRLIKNIKPIKYEINGISIKLNPVSYIDFHLIAYGKHDEEIIEWLDQYLKPDDLFLDIGANIGYFSLYAAKIRKANVIAFEPSKRELSRFYENIALNQLNSITLYPYALGTKTTKLTLNIADYQNPGKNSIVVSKSDKQFSTQEDINVCALGDLVSLSQISKIKLIKIDVEGYEYQILIGLSSFMELLTQTVFIIEITTYADKDPKMEQSQLIYNFFDNYNYTAKIGLKLNKQYNEVFIKS